jgi:hypothetical protein
MCHVFMTVQFLMAVTTNVIVSWGVTSCSLGNNVFSSENILKMKAVDSSKKLANFAETSELHNI